MKALIIKDHPGTKEIAKQANSLQDYFKKNIKAGKDVPAAAWQKRVFALRRAVMHELIFQVQRNASLAEKMGNGFSVSFDFNAFFHPIETEHGASRKSAIPFKLDAGADSAALLAVVNSHTDMFGNSISTLQAPSASGGKRKMELGGFELDLDKGWAEINYPYSKTGPVAAGFPLSWLEAKIREYFNMVATLPANVVDSLARMAE